MSQAIFWFRQDLRLADSPGLTAAAQYDTVLPIYIFDETVPEPYAMGGASRVWLHHSLQDLNKTLGKALNCYSGDPKKILAGILDKYDIDAVFWHRCYEPWQISRDKDIKTWLAETNTHCESYNGSLLWEPWQVLKADKTPYRVFTPYYRKGCLQAEPPATPLAPPKLHCKRLESSGDIADLPLLTGRPWEVQMMQHWQPGEAGAMARLQDFFDEGLAGYKEGRNLPAEKHTSRLSAHLHFGEISPRQVWRGATEAGAALGAEEDLDNFHSELGWREFSYYLLYHFPGLPSENFQNKFDAFPWQEDAAFLTAWQRGQTGIPLVDAGMRELWQTGSMHNRVRMVVASLLVKNGLVHWHHGRDWFWECLVDADLASNSASWQWVAGSGADAAPFFRIFNPVTQGEKFDKAGVYTRRYVPELASLPDKYLFSPWTAPEAVLTVAGIVLGETYPKPIIDLKASREQALAAYQTIKG